MPGTPDGEAPPQRGSRRVRPTRVAPVAIFLREDAPWLLNPTPLEPEPTLFGSPLSHPAREVLDALGRVGASFMGEIVRATRRLPSEVEDALWELAAAGLFSDSREPGIGKVRHQRGLQTTRTDPRRLRSRTATAHADPV